jgi:hypothetical protein
MKPFLLLFALTAIFASESVAEKPVHLFILSGQSNMAGMDPEAGFMTEAKKQFKDEKVVYIKVAKGGQPICRWLEEWQDIAKKNGLDERLIKRIHKGGKVEFYQPILDQYKEMLEKHHKFESVTFCWMQGERDANGGGQPAYKDSLKLLISKLRRDLERPDMNIVIGRLSDAGQKKPSWGAMRKIQMEIVDEDPSGAWVDVDDLNDREKDGKVSNAVHYNRPEGYVTLGRRFARQGHALVTGKEPAENGRPGDRAPQELEKKENKKEEKQEKKKSTKTAGPRWQVSTTEDWQAFIADADGIKIADGHAIAEKPQVSFTSQLRQFPDPIRLKDIELRQSVEWLNWQPCSLYQPNMKNAPVMISHSPNDHWIIAQYRSAEQLVEAYQAKVADAQKSNRKPPPPLTFSIGGFEPEEVTLEGYDEKLVTTPFPNQYQPSEWKGDYSKPPLKRAWQSGYHAWHSRDMINWVHYGPTAAAPTVTTAEYADGKTFFYYDRPNDRDPHLIIDHDLRDGLPGEDKGLAFDAPWGGSDVGVIRDLKGRFHMISENWQPINASKRSWDSPLASHMVSEDGIKDFKILKPAVDYRTKPTGKTATFEHPHWNDEEKVVTYEIHEPRQDAFGDWAAIAIGGQYYLVSDYDPANAHGRSGMSVALFTSEDINKPFRFYGHIGSGHPDPDIMFADGKFYLITQTATDFVSDGPWIGTAKLRAGVDQDGDGRIDHWSKWQDTRETYSSIPGFAKQVDRTPAKMSFADLPAGKGFQIEVKLLSPEGHKSLPKLDQLIATFDSSQK